MSQDLEIGSLSTADSISSAICRLYGSGFHGTGVVHVTSVWRKDPETQLVIRIGPDAPSSGVDQFILNWARARADAIITTGRILRQEPELSHHLQGPGSSAEGLTRWRAEVLGKPRPPISLILTSGRDLDFSHPLFSGPSRIVILTDRRGAWNLESRASDAGVELVALDNPTPRDAIGMLRLEFGCATISVEAGPSVSRQYYEPPAIVDELLLSVYRGEPLPPGARGRRHVTQQQIERTFHEPHPAYSAMGEDGRSPWDFHRYVRL